MKKKKEMRYYVSNWAKPSFESRFHKHIRAINQLSEVSVARLQQISLQGKLICWSMKVLGLVGASALVLDRICRWSETFRSL